MKLPFKLKSILSFFLLVFFACEEAEFDNPLDSENNSDFVGNSLEWLDESISENQASFMWSGTDGYESFTQSRYKHIHLSAPSGYGTTTRVVSGWTSWTENLFSVEMLNLDEGEHSLEVQSRYISTDSLSNMIEIDKTFEVDNLASSPFVRLYPMHQYVESGSTFTLSIVGDNLDSLRLFECEIDFGSSTDFMDFDPLPNQANDATIDFYTLQGSSIVLSVGIQNGLNSITGSNTSLATLAFKCYSDTEINVKNIVFYDKNYNLINMESMGAYVEVSN